MVIRRGISFQKLEQQISGSFVVIVRQEKLEKAVTKDTHWVKNQWLELTVGVFICRAPRESTGK